MGAYYLLCKVFVFRAWQAQWTHAFDLIKGLILRMNTEEYNLGKWKDIIQHKLVTEAGNQVCIYLDVSNRQKWGGWLASPHTPVLYKHNSWFTSTEVWEEAGPTLLTGRCDGRSGQRDEVVTQAIFCTRITPVDPKPRIISKGRGFYMLKKIYIHADCARFRDDARGHESGARRV